MIPSAAPSTSNYARDTILWWVWGNALSSPPSPKMGMNPRICASFEAVRGFLS